jgi:ribosome-associated protein
MAQIPVTEQLELDEDELVWTFVHSSGPGGQNVNKVSSAVQLRFDIPHSRSIPKDIQQRLVALAGSRVTQDGILVLKGTRFRTQEQNRRDALERLVQLIRQAAAKSKPRRRTHPPASAKRRRLDHKRRRSQLKALRRRVTQHDD